MGKSEKQMALITLRGLLGRDGRSMGQKELADITGCSLATIQSVELGRLKLSESLAARIFSATGADTGWLLKNDPTVPLLDWRTGAPYTRAIFEELQGKKRLPTNLAKYNFRRYLLDQLGRMSYCLEHIEKQSHEAVSVFMYRFEKTLDEIESDLGKGWVPPKGNRLQAVCRMVSPWLDAKIYVPTPEKLAETEKKYGHLLKKSLPTRDTIPSDEQSETPPKTLDELPKHPTSSKAQRVHGSSRKAR